MTDREEFADWICRPAVLSAVRAERERCARLADECGHAAESASQRYLAARIAVRIRTGEAATG
jgi:hypothetical protein